MDQNTTSVENGTLTITRVFSAPLARVWQMFTDTEEIKKWWGPAGFTAPHVTVDLKEGGKYLYCMRAGEGMGEFTGKDFWSTGTYKEIVPMEKIVMTDSFADKDGNIVSSTEYGMAEMALELLVTLTFDDLGDGKTKLTLVHEGFPYEGETGKQASEGWGTSLDKLEANL